MFDGCFPHNTLIQQAGVSFPLVMGFMLNTFTLLEKNGKLHELICILCYSAISAGPRKEQYLVSKGAKLKTSAQQSVIRMDVYSTSITNTCDFSQYCH